MADNEEKTSEGIIGSLIPGKSSEAVEFREAAISFQDKILELESKSDDKLFLDHVSIAKSSLATSAHYVRRSMEILEDLSSAEE